MTKPFYSAEQVKAFREQVRDDIAKLEGTGKWCDPANPCYGDGRYANGLLEKYGVDSIGDLKRWLKRGWKRKKK